ncbi:MAG: glucose-6-phosphate isomerase, partial [Polaromonas sp.]|nr:glucose-6-phosphate isomerase [Polaromonas sp.]
MTTSRCDKTAAWAALQAHFETRGKAFDLREAFAQDGQRFENFS